MIKTFDSKLAELEMEKSKLDLDFLQNQKEEYNGKLCKILEKSDNEWDENNAAHDLYKAKEYFRKIKEIDQKIENNSDFLENIDNKISFYQKRKERVKNIPLYRDTEEWIAETLWDDPLYQYAKKIDNKELINLIETRKMTESDYEKYMEKMYQDTFKSVFNKEEKQITRKTITLPEWMSEQIKEELTWNKELTSQEIESFLKKELKKNSWEIKLSHIKNTFKWKENQAYQYIRRLIINYPEFSIIDAIENKATTSSTQSKRDKLISSISSEPQEIRDERIKKDKLLKNLFILWNIEDLELRIDGYLELFEQIWCKFSDKDDFAANLYNAITTYTHVQIEKEIQKILTSIIKENLYPIKTEKYGYLAYKFSRSCDNWRIVLYPNWEMFKICSHNDYERIISTQPPIDKR